MEEQKQLTARETQILKLIVASYSNPQIAGKLYISLNTVKMHISNIYKKLCASNRVGAALKYNEMHKD